MKTNILYFPYIQVPNTVWITQMLLYWDRVSSIVPFEYIADPERLEPFMRDLVREELVQQVLPGDYIRTIPAFSDSFLRYIVALGEPDLNRRRGGLESGRTSQIHIEKVGTVGESLVELGLARSAGYPWYALDRDTADDFMAYLATTLGQLDEIDSIPATDSQAYLERVIRAGVSDSQLSAQLESLRTRVLDRVLPVPAHPVEPLAIRLFKERHFDELRVFRFRIERELTATLNITDERLRERQLGIFLDETDSMINEIEAKMSGAGWSTTRSTLSVAAAIPGVSPVLGLISAVWDALGAGPPEQTAREFAYAAYARVEL